ncbi:MAG TPA: glycosyltransferase family 4 protein [Thermoanaerobaculia bacterium]|nr:glycosyltransferase family 4 protein [Thermoanaerobaculia bacterium]
MTTLRLLLTSPLALSPEAGVSQVALSLAEALSQRGHEVRTWAPPAPPPGLGPWRRRLWAVGRLETFLASQPRFDFVDVTPVLAHRRLRRFAPLVVRSVQPEWLYYLADLRAALRRPTPRRLAHRLLDLGPQLRCLAGLHAAKRILCLGNQDRRWVATRLPWLRPRLGTWVNAPEPALQRRLAELRAGRVAPETGPLHWLWIGRWAEHKGIRRLRVFAEEWLSRRPEDRITLAGCGPAAVADLSAEHLAAGRLRVVPRFGREELPALLAEHHAGLFTSQVEGWGLSVNEMLEAGLTVFATPAGGVRDLAPFFPHQLRPFPPPADLEPSRLAVPEVAEGYYRRFTWAAIAEAYERELK